ncbi:uncharacterized protein LOC108092831 [Drosophila ficusphila]|uniref:uncharacterized protein LOC108092831 n=1 Tax=Drosophila ficusphila TaxID=30025 RepID=UPI0007E6A233|nr:uncharacterized protein LOC108092831 [Drosophila ficusphila]
MAVLARFVQYLSESCVQLFYSFRSGCIVKSSIFLNTEKNRMANFLKTEDQMKISEIVEKLVKQNSKRYTNDDAYFDLPCCSRDISLSCPEMSGIQAVCAFESMVPQAGSPYTYRVGQLLNIGRLVAHRMVDSDGNSNVSLNRDQLNERLRSAGIYHNRLGKPCGLLPETENGGRGDTDPGKRNPNLPTA